MKVRDLNQETIYENCELVTQWNEIAEWFEHIGIPENYLDNVGCIFVDCSSGGVDHFFICEEQVPSLGAYLYSVDEWTLGEVSDPTSY